MSDSQPTNGTNEKSASKTDNINSTSNSRISWQADLPESVKEKQEQVSIPD